MPPNSIEVVIRAVDQATSVLNSVRGTTDQLAASIRGVNAASVQLSSNNGTAKMAADFDKSAQSAKLLAGEVNKLSAVLAAAGHNIPTPQLRQFLLQTSQATGLATSTIGTIFSQLSTKLGNFASAPQLQQLTQGIIATSKQFGTSLGGTTQSVVNVISGLSNQIKDTGISISRFTPLAQRAGAVITAMGQSTGSAIQGLSGLSQQGQNITTGLNAIQSATKGVTTQFQQASSAARLFQAALIATGLKSLVTGVIEAQISLDRISRFFEIAGGSAQNAAIDLKFVHDEADRLGLPFRELADSFGKFAVAASQAGYSSDEIRKIFTSTSEALTVMNAGAQQTQLAFLALEQMASQGVVHMQELRLQLAGQIPAAVQIMADSLGVSVAKLYQMVSAGEVLSRDALPKLADGFKKTFGGQVTAAAADVQSAIARVGNALLDLQLKVSQTGFGDSFKKSMKDIENALKSPGAVEGVSALLNALGKLVAFITQNARAFLLLATGVSVLTGNFVTAGALLSLFGASLTGAASKADQAREKFAALNKSIQDQAVALSKFTDIPFDEILSTPLEQLETRLAKAPATLVQAFKKSREELARLTKEIGDSLSKTAPPTATNRPGKPLDLFDPKTQEELDKAQKKTREAVDKLNSEIDAAKDEVKAGFVELNAEVTGSIEEQYEALIIRQRSLLRKAVEDADRERTELIADLEKRQKKPASPEQLAEINKAFAGRTAAAEQLAQLEILKKTPDEIRKIIELAKKRLDLEIALRTEMEKGSQTVLDARSVSLQNELDLAQQRGASEEEILKILKDQNDTEKAKLILQRQTALNAAKDAEQKASLEPNIQQQKILLQQSATQRAEAEKINEQIAGLDVSFRKAITSGEGLTQQFELQRQAADRTAEALKGQLELATAQNQPWSEIAAIADKYLDTQVKSLRIEEQRLEFLIKQNEALKDANPAVLDDLRAQLTLVRLQITNMPLEVAKLIDAFDPLSEAAKAVAQSITESFGNIFDVLTDKSLSFSQRIFNLFAKTGESITKALFQRLIAQPIAEDMEAALQQLLGRPSVPDRQSKLGQTFSGLAQGIAGLLGIKPANPVPEAIQTAGEAEAAENLGERRPISAVLKQFPLNQTSAGVDAARAQQIAADASKRAADLMSEAAASHKDAAKDLSNAATAIKSIPSSGISATPGSSEIDRATELSQQIAAAVARRAEAERTVPADAEGEAAKQREITSRSREIEALVDLRSAVLENMGKTQPVKIVEPRIVETDVTQVSDQAANLLQGKNPAQENVQLGPFPEPHDPLAELAEELGKVGTQSGPGQTVINNGTVAVPTSIASSNNQGDIFGSIQSLLGPLSGIAGLAGGQQGRSGFDIASGIFGVGKNLFSIYDAFTKITGLLGEAGNIGTAGSALGGAFAGGAQAFPNALGGLGAFEGFNFPSFSFPTFHEGGAIGAPSGLSRMVDPAIFAGARRLHDGGLVAGERPIIARDDEFMMGPGATREIGIPMLNYMNATREIPGKGMRMAGNAAVKLGGASRMGPGGWAQNSGDNPMRADHARDNAPIQQTIYLVDQRPPVPSPNDIIAILENDMVARNGRSAKAVQHVLKRTR